MTAIFSHFEHDHHEQIVFCSDAQTGLKAIIAIHDTCLGPALGGCRIYPYCDEKEALQDVLRLSRAMTYKASLANLDLGGGKSVIIADPLREKSPALLKAFGQAVERLAGRYIVAEDVGSSVEDMEMIHEVTGHVAGLSSGGGDPSPATARGVLMGMKAALKYQRGQGSLKGVTVALQGLGHVGFALAEMLATEGASLKVSDVRSDVLTEAKERWGAEIVENKAIHAVSADIFAPCALGAILNDQTLPALKASAIVGSANNQLARPEHGDMLHKAGKLYAPDYAVNAGGLINVAHELPDYGGYNAEKAYQKIDALYETMLAIFHKADHEHISTAKAADLCALERLNHQKTISHALSAAE